MILHVSEQSMNLSEINDLKRYSVQIAQSDLSTEEILSGHSHLVQISSTEVAVSPQILRNLADAFAQNASWRSDFQSMMQYASEKGWVTSAGEIVGHIERN